MPCLTSAQKTELEAQRDIKIAQLASLRTAIESGTTHIAEYRFDSGEGSQRVQYRSIKQMYDVEELLQRRLDSINQRLSGSGIINMEMGRRC